MDSSAVSRHTLLQHIWSLWYLRDHFFSYFSMVGLILTAYSVTEAKTSIFSSQCNENSTTECMEPILYYLVLIYCIGLLVAFFTEASLILFFVHSTQPQSLAYFVHLELVNGSIQFQMIRGGQYLLVLLAILSMVLSVYYASPTHSIQVSGFLLFLGMLTLTLLNLIKKTINTTGVHSQMRIPTIIIRHERFSKPQTILAHVKHVAGLNESVHSAFCYDRTLINHPAYCHLDPNVVDSIIATPDAYTTLKIEFYGKLHMEYVA